MSVCERQEAIHLEQNALKDAVSTDCPSRRIAIHLLSNGVALVALKRADKLGNKEAHRVIHAVDKK